MSQTNLLIDYRNSFSLVPNNLHDCKTRARTFRGPHSSVQVTHTDYSTACNNGLKEGGAKPGPTTDTSSRIARLKKLQKRTRSSKAATQMNEGTDRGAHPSVQNSTNGHTGYWRAQLFGNTTRNIPFQTSGIGGDSSDVTYFKNVFERISLNSTNTNSN